MDTISRLFSTSDPVPHPWGVGMPAYLQLHSFGELIYETFGRHPLLVGSALVKKRLHRDVDVRLVLTATEFALRLGPLEQISCPLTPWAHYCYAFSLVAERMTGLPVDFQIQDTSRALAYLEQPRLLLGSGFDNVSMKGHPSATS